jgi:DnaK suppressor protein
MRAVPRGLGTMVHAVIEKCRAELQSQLDELLAGAERTVVDMTHVEEENFPDPTDRASLESNRNFTLRLRDRDRKLVAKIKEAIKRIEGGTFGICDGCGGEIEEKRLIARPVTSLCIDCKTVAEEEEVK